MPVKYAKEDLSVGDEDVATPEKIWKWKYLERIAGEISQGKVFLLVYSLVPIAQRL